MPPPDKLTTLRLECAIYVQLLIQPAQLAQAMRWLGWLPKSCHRRRQAGFTMVELLITLMILGEIATFTIPKVLSAQQDSQRIAVLKETIGALSEITYNGVLTQQLTSETITAYYSSKLNAIKVCSTNANTQGCWAHTSFDAGNQAEPGFILHNGASLAGFASNAGFAQEHVMIDWNGPAGSNTEGDDQIMLRIVFNNSAGDRSGTVIARPTKPLSVALFEEIYQ